MKITCQSCQSKYTVSDDKVQGRTVKIKCRKCGATILVNSAGVVANGAVADPESASSGPSDGATFLVNVAESDQRSMTLAEIVGSYNASVITADTYVWADGMADWQPLGQVDAIVAALNGAPAAAAPAAAPAQQPSYPPAAAQPSFGAPPGAYGGSPSQPGYGASPSQPAYGASPSQPAYGGSGAQQYGGGAAAAAPVESASAARAAARRDPLRPSQDLFGGGVGHEPQRPSTDDVATSAPLFSAGAAAAASGKREENSMLFSLNALTAKAGPSASSSSKTTATKEDSGVIDLKALAAGGSAPSPVAAIVPDDGGLFQLAAPIGASAPAAPAVVSIVEPAQKNRGPLFVGIGIAVAGLAIAGAFFGMKAGDPPPQNLTQTTAPAAPTPPPLETTPGPPPEASASAAPTASASAVVKAGPRPTGPRPAGTGAAQSGGASTAPASTAPKRGNCGCAPSDLMCAMACSAKGK